MSAINMTSSEMLKANHLRKWLEEMEEIKEPELYRTFEICQEVAQNYIGAPNTTCYSTKEETLLYRSKIVSLFPNLRLKPIKHNLTKVKKHTINLKVIIIQAKNLRPKDVNDKNDPYCNLWIDSTKKRRTCIKKQTIHPYWNEEFTFENISMDDSLTVEVWDADSASIASAAREITNVRGIDTFFRYLKDVVETAVPLLENDDLIGNVVIPIKEIPFVNIEGDVTNNTIWYNLKLNEDTNGSVLIGFEFQVKSKQNIIQDLIDHSNMCRIFLEDHLKDSEFTSYKTERLNEIFDPSAWTLLKQHSLQANLFPLSHYICLWIRISKKMQNLKTKYNYNMCANLLRKVKNIAEKVTVDPLLQTIFIDDLKCFEEFCMKDLNCLHTNFHINGEEKHRIQSFFGLLEIMSRFLPDMKEKMKIAIQIDATNSYKLSNELNSDITLSKKIRPYIEKFVQNSVTDVKREKTFKLYLTIKSFVDHILKNISRNETQLQMKQYQQWFGNEIMHAWFQDGVQSCINWIDDSLRMDKLEPISNDVQTGTSLMDLNDSLFHTIFTIWEILDWFDIAATRKLIECFNDYFSYYTMQLVTKLEKENYYTPNKPENSFRPKC
ncbi:BAI1-associated protein 3-like isoform X2 [Centruroides sculpturatus]|uniref:BAI1-associated protein 3-like isoform X2 n=1 Tax=Centruroides sculpturatus TaxID=218467 RepID=UPI000C6EC3AF|nr:BAI1-associated protein 3-like isoform X2 [Centruroides sculpturatus]